MPEQVEQVVMNTIPTPQEDKSVEYKRLVGAGERGKFVMGFVRLQNITKKNYAGDGVDECFRLTFRSKDEPNGYVNHDVKASAKSNSHLFASVQNMTDGKLKTKEGSAFADAKEVFELLTGCMDKWYEIKVEGKTWKDSVWVNVVNDQIEPHTGPGMPPSAFFDRAVSSSEVTSPGGLNDGELEEIKFDDDDIPF